jgi:hypothetical protein
MTAQSGAVDSRRKILGLIESLICNPSVGFSQNPLNGSARPAALYQLSLIKVWCPSMNSANIPIPPT